MRPIRALAALPILAVALLGASPAPSAGARVRIAGFAFVPATLTVTAGTRVTFVNDDEEPHTATAADGSFDSEALDLHQTWQHVFAVPGRYAYVCELHPHMKGTVIVR